ncbi:MAG: hypothetical protein AB7N76_12710 [Planctomycetota bacterium]
MGAVGFLNRAAILELIEPPMSSASRAPAPADKKQTADEEASRAARAELAALQDKKREAEAALECTRAEKEQRERDHSEEATRAARAELAALQEKQREAEAALERARAEKEQRENDRREEEAARQRRERAREEREAAIAYRERLQREREEAKARKERLEVIRQEAEQQAAERERAERERASREQAERHPVRGLPDAGSLPSNTPSPVYGNANLYVRLVQAPLKKPDGTDWDVGALASKAVDPLLAKAATKLALTGEPTSVLISAVMASPKGRQFAEVLKAMIGRTAAPDLVLVLVGPDGTTLQSPLVKNSHVAGWSSPFCSVPAGTATGNLVFALWDVDLQFHDPIFTATVPIAELRRLGGLQITGEDGSALVLGLEPAR